MFTPNNRIHINFSTERASDGSIIRSSLMVNINTEEVGTALELYHDLKKRLEHDNNVIEKSGNGQINPFPVCPDHKIKMIMRTRHSDNSLFFGCPLYASRGCKRTKQYPITWKTNIPIQHNTCPGSNAYA